MAKIDQVNNGDSGLDSRTKINEALATVEVDGTTITGDGITTPLVAQPNNAKADKVTGATDGNLAGLDTNGNLTDSGSKSSDFATSAQGVKADSATQPGDNVSTLTNDEGFIDSDGNTLTNTTVNGVDLTTGGVATKFLDEQGNYTTPSGTGGEANTTSNSGTGEGLALPKSGVDLPFKSLKATGGATASSDSDSVTINVDPSQYATAAQGGKADSATQPGDNVSTLNNDANYIDAAGAPVQPGDNVSIFNNNANYEQNTINSVTAGEPTGSDVVLNVVSLTQAEYDAGTPVATTIYNITDA